MTKGVTQSQFYMWRTLFAVAHADDVVTDEELRFMVEALHDVPFSEAQETILNEDAKHAQDIETMFAGITDVHDQAQFFHFARELVHIDGDYSSEEQAVMLKLKELHLKCANLDDLVGRIDMKLEDEECVSLPKKKPEPHNFKDKVYSFRNAFLGKRFKEKK